MELATSLTLPQSRMLMATADGELYIAQIPQVI